MKTATPKDTQDHMLGAGALTFDACTSDELLQFMVFGEIVFG